MGESGLIAGIHQAILEELGEIEAELSRLRERAYLSPAEQQQVWNLLIRQEILSRSCQQLADQNWGSHLAQLWEKIS